MIPGGISGKLGTRYEAKWVVRCFMDVIGNKAQWLNFEGVETEYQGFECALARGETTEWHQCKINAPNGNWTIRALKREGILRAFSKRFSRSSNAHCWFISQGNADDFKILSEDARTANSPEQYLEILSSKHNQDFQQLKEAWAQPDEVIFNWLRRCEVRCIPEGELDSFIDSYGDLYFQNGGKSAYPNLRDILENHFNKTLTTESARAAIKSHGVLKFKNWAFDPSISQRLKEETTAYLETYTPFGSGGETITRNQSTQLVDEILRVEGSDLILLTGVAGSGKSGIVRTAIEQLREREIPHLAFRVDQHLSCGTREELGKKLTGREESPVSTLKGTFLEKNSVLFIDQVDAVSEVSGREGQVKDVIFPMITDATLFGDVKIVLVCRTFDLESDARLKRLKEAQRTKQIDIPLLDWEKDIEPLLKKKNINGSTFKEPQRQLLCLPINLSVFLEIDDPDFLFHSRFSLHEKLIEKKQRTIAAERKPSWPLLKPLIAMCDWMSKRQKLNAPVSVMDDYPGAIDILRSEGLIISSRGQVSFFHESFFDHIYARAFVKKDISLIDFLRETEQHLFRRTQVRQILEALRQDDLERYFQELSSVLESSHVRFHIKAAICQWLNTIDVPGDAEFKIISKFDKTGDKFHQFFRSAVLSTEAWFDLLNKKSWIKGELEGQNVARTEAVLWWFSNIAGERPIEVASLLRIWWDNNDDRAERLLNWFGHIRRAKPDDALFRLCEDLINSHPVNLFEEQGRDRIMMLLYSWTEKSPEQCGRVLHALFEAWFALHPQRNPFARDEGKTFDTHSLTKLEKKSPLAFLQGTTDALVRSIDMVVSEGKSGCHWYDFNRRVYSGHHFGFDEFLAIYRSALKKVVKENPEEAMSHLEKLDPHKHECLMHLHLESIQANPLKLGKHLPKLVHDKMIFDAGWNGTGWFSFAHAYRAAFQHLRPDEKDLIEQIIVAHVPELDYAILTLKKVRQEGEIEPYRTKEGVIRNLRYSGYEQWCVLETIGKDMLGQRSRSRLLELQRKFPKEKLLRPHHNEARWGNSPIKKPQCKRMNDQHWFSAIQRYSNNEERRRGHGFVDGGARNLAGELREETKKDPERFAKLSLKIPDTAHPSYMEHILWGLAESEALPDELLVQVVLYAHRHPEKPFGTRISYLIEKHPQIASNSEILEMLIWYALKGKADENQISDAQHTDRETITIETLLQKSGTIYMRGINGERGQAWETLGTILWKVPEAEPRVWETIDIALEKESRISVRCCIMKPLLPLFNMNKERFSESIRKLIILPEGVAQQSDASRLSPLITSAGIQLFPYIFNWLPELGSELAQLLLESGDETTELMGAWLIFCASFSHGTHIQKADELEALSVNHRRLLADVASQAINWAENRNRAEKLLKRFFFDEDEQIRQKAADAFRHIKADEVEKYRELTVIFLKSPAFMENSASVMHMLKSATGDVLELIVEAAQQLIRNIVDRGDECGSHAADAHYLQDLLKREYTASESKPEARKIILDLIDLMLKNEIYGVEGIVAAHERW